MLDTRRLRSRVFQSSIDDIIRGCSMPSNASMPDDTPERQAPSDDTVVPESSAASRDEASTYSEPHTEVVSNPPDQAANTVAEDATLPPRAPDIDSIPDDMTLPPRPPTDATAFDTEGLNSQEPGTEHSDPNATLAQTELNAPAMRVKYFGEYELLQEIARGGMGVVYKARQIKLNRIVALKMILSGQLASKEDVDRFYTEAEAAARLEHPGIVPIFEIGEHNDQHFFSMGFIEGASLADRVKEGPLPPREAAAITKQVVEAIAFAHQNNVIHRDLKPANVLIDGNGQAKVTDFGLAKQTDRNAELTGTGQIMGTPAYMPPEQASGDTKNVGTAADIYSLGAILYALLTGRAPFLSASVMDTLVQVLENDPVAPRKLNPAIHPDLEIICLKCLSKVQANRYQSATEMAQDLDRFLNGEPIHAKASTLLSRTWSTMLSETRHAEVMAMWSRVWKWHAFLVFVLFVATNAMQWTNAEPTTVAMLWVPGLGSILFVTWYFRFRNGTPLTPIEKQLGQVWGAFLVAAILTGIINHLMHLETLRLLPLVVLECGLAFGCMAAILGGSFYPISIACFVVSVSMPIVPTLGPTIFGVLFAVGLLVPAIKYSREY
jgi:eukaryotic-like serine/threonine-protein kinase